MVKKLMRLHTRSLSAIPYSQKIRTCLFTGCDEPALVSPSACLLPPYHRYSRWNRGSVRGGQAMDWKHLLAYITGSVDEELLLRNEYLVTENRILRQQITGRVSL